MILSHFGLNFKLISFSDDHLQKRIKLSRIRNFLVNFDESSLAKSYEIGYSFMFWLEFLLEILLNITT